ncbi:MAG: chemotaxis protein CheW [Spirochaetota bacterium]|jgi:purine-binding chemotaxis protein CheW|nr:chemotaxis protein CheW [Spirochaetota bacterium]NMA56047.1 chemotaxis protein CheW [Treponema sp.]HPY52380.1 chemotaxis protein CheW [Treponemataceae bacterium]
MENTRKKMSVGERYLSFVIDNENYCIDILKVKELLGMTTITPLPKTDNFIKGVINLRGQIIPIIDLRLKFGLEEIPYTKQTGIIIVEVSFSGEGMLMGIIVDRILEVINITEDNISKISYLNARIKAEYIRGIANTEDGIKIILDVLKILNSDELSLMKETVAS